MQIGILNKEKKEKLLREVIVKIGLKQKDEEDGITVEALLDSRVTGWWWVQSLQRSTILRWKGWIDQFIWGI